MMANFDALLTFSNCILCQKEVLGKTFKTIISGIDVELFFPRLDENTDSVYKSKGNLLPLAPPEIGEKWRRGEKPLFWGMIMTYPKCNVSVESIAVRVSCADGTENKTAQSLYGNIKERNNIKEWEHKFIDYILLLTKRNSFEGKNHKRKECRFEVLSDNIEITYHDTLYGYIRSDSDYASSDIVTQAIQFASSEKELLLEYQMLLSAYESINNGRNRQAVLDVCSAIEICLNKCIEKYCEDKDINTKILFDKYRFLGDKFELVKKLDNSFSSLGYFNNIVKSRNRLMHNENVFPDESEVKEMIKYVEIILKHYHSTYY